ncbi:uncharacterized protein ATC70_002879 [Mucor velutinosus]|uniref:Uncharacterized protein n=1 Tax=Mucor velutinosus TaxID=708070 RepID=A0AAN7HMK8_9FUNG|nr:hypothetical protein ATC70_002879 [Mucor velutinosus]
MATLDAFLIRGKKKTQSSSSSSSLQDTHTHHAFVNPFTVQVKKPLSKKALIEKPARHQTKRNTIAHYFTPATRDADVEMEEAAADVCVIRNKMPVMNLWNVIQYELEQDPFYHGIMDESSVPTTTSSTLAISSHCVKRRRSRQADAEQSSKRLRKTDHELSSIMIRFLNMGSSVIKHHPPVPSSLDLINEFSEDTEDLSRRVRHKQTWQESNLFLYHMTQEFLNVAINQ